MSKYYLKQLCYILYAAGKNHMTMEGLHENISAEDISRKITEFEKKAPKSLVKILKETISSASK